MPVILLAEIIRYLEQLGRKAHALLEDGHIRPSYCWPLDYDYCHCVILALIMPAEFLRSAFRPSLSPDDIYGQRAEIPISCHYIYY